jgi:hypothetical protein
MFFKKNKTNLIRMNILTREGIPVSQLPAGGISSTTQSLDTGGIANSGTTSDTPLEKFLRDILQEGIPFVDGIAPKSGTQSTWKAKSSPTTFSQSEAPVYSSEKTVSVKGSDDGNGKERTEIWYSRRSCHRNAAEKRTASWAEFTKAFYSHHAETEHQYVPTVIGVRRALHWDTTSLEFEINGEKCTDIICELWEMKHKIEPKPLQNRVFPTLQIAARLEGKDETIFLQTPVSEFAASTYAEYAKDKSLVVASYTAVERLRILPDSGEIEWIMATASDAGGVLPQFVQNLAVPGEVPKDVKMFLEWIPSQRT